MTWEKSNPGARETQCRMRSAQQLPGPDANPGMVLWERLDSAILIREGVRMTIELARDVEDFLQKQLRNGGCADASQLVNDVLRSMRDQQMKPFAVTPE